MSKFIRCTGLTTEQAIEAGKLLALVEGVTIIDGFDFIFCITYIPSTVLVVQDGVLKCYCEEDFCSNGMVEVLVTAEGLEEL